MAKDPKYKFNNPFFNEFVFHTVLNAPHDVKNRLPINLLRYTTSVEKMKAFADRASLEKKLEMLTRLGGAFSLSVHPPMYLSKEKLEEVLDNYLDGKRLDDIDDMLHNRVFVQTDREVMAIHALMAMNCHNETYMLNRDYTLIATQIQMDKKIETRTPDIELVKEVMNDHKMLCKFMLYNLLNQNFVDSGTGYKVKELMILLYMFVNRNDYIPASTIHDFFRNTYSSNMISRTLYRLSQSLHITQFPRQYRYAITGLGIQVLANYVNRIINQTLSF